MAPFYLFEERSDSNMETQVKSFFLNDAGDIPNNPDLPVIVYQGAFEDRLDMDAQFEQHNWTGTWTGDVYDYHHYHTNTHEVLGVKTGQATVLIGGDSGERLELKAGDVVVLPAGTGHKKIESSEDFAVVGAYPNGSTPDLKQKDPGVRAQAISQIKNVPVPATDPVYGENGPLLDKWVK
jgi:uncharacterized protein YjlB